MPDIVAGIIVVILLVFAIGSIILSVEERELRESSKDEELYERK